MSKQPSVSFCHNRMGSAFSLGRIFGIQFRLHYSWFIIFALITVSLSWQYFPFVYPGWNRLIYWVAGIFTSLLFFTSVVAHELSHSLVGRANGIPVKSITLFIFGGMAHMAREATRYGAEFKMAAAGPISSLVIGGLFFLVYLLVGGLNEPVAAMSYWLARVNVILAVFNLIPGFPLDGGRVLRSILWRFSGNYKRSTRIATRIGQGVGYLFIMGGILVIVLFSQQWFSGLWLVFIGWFLSNIASTSYRQAQWQLALHGVTVSETMTSSCPVVSSNITVSRLVQEYMFPGGHRCFLVADEGELEGILTLQDIKSVGQSDWGVVEVKNIMTPVEKLKVVYPGQEASNVLEQMDGSNINQMPVVSEGRVIGLITHDNLIRFLRTRSELEA